MASSTTLSTASSTLTSLGPLTTTFTPDADCTSTFYRYDYGTDLAFFHLGVDTSTSACMPSGWNNNVGAHYSPGICPSGYTPACSTIVSSETQAICCPSKYSCHSSSNLPWYTTDLCVSQMGSTQSYHYVTVVAGESDQTTSSSGKEGINAFGISIRYRATDSISAGTLVTAATTAAASTATTTSAAVSSSNSSNNSSNNSSSSSSGLSSGAKAAIGVCVAVGALAIIAAMAVFLLRRKRQRRSVLAVDGQPSPAPADPYGYAPPPEQKFMQSAQTPIAEAPSNGRWGATTTELAELPASR